MTVNLTDIEAGTSSKASINPIPKRVTRTQHCIQSYYKRKDEIVLLQMRSGHWNVVSASSLLAKLEQSSFLVINQS